MESLYAVCKGFTDPVFIIFILLVAALIVCSIGSKKKNGILILGLAIFLLYGLSIAPVPNYLAYSLEKDYFNMPEIKKPLDIIIVLGGGAQDIHALNHPIASESSSARLLHGVKIFNKYGARYLICAGKGVAEISEGELMAQMAVDLGVPRNRIRVDSKSNNTWEHAVELNKMFADKNINIGIVTSCYHMKRAEKEFKKYFKNVVPLPASYLYSSSSKPSKNVLRYIPQTGELSATAVALREFIGSAWYKIKSI